MLLQQGLMRAAYEALDKDKDGTVSCKEVCDFLRVSQADGIMEEVRAGHRPGQGGSMIGRWAA